MTGKRIIWFSVAVILLLVFFYLYGGSTVPQGQQPLVRLNNSNIGSLRDAFNAPANSIRLLVLVSPTWAVCLQGASALEKLLNEQRDPKIRVFVIWEPVLPTDLGAPSTATLRRVSDLRASQYWDKARMVSHLMGEQDRSSVVWDYVAVYEPGKIWNQVPPDAVFSDNPVVRAIGGASNAVQRLLKENMHWYKLADTVLKNVSGRLEMHVNKMRQTYVLAVL